MWRSIAAVFLLSSTLTIHAAPPPRATKARVHMKRGAAGVAIDVRARGHARPPIVQMNLQARERDDAMLLAMSDGTETYTGTWRDPRPGDFGLIRTELAAADGRAEWHVTEFTVTPAGVDGTTVIRARDRSLEAAVATPAGTQALFGVLTHEEIEGPLPQSMTLASPPVEIVLLSGTTQASDAWVVMHLPPGVNDALLLYRESDSASWRTIETKFEPLLRLIAGRAPLFGTFVLARRNR